MPVLWWSLTIFLFIIGMIGIVIPLLPGTTIIFAAAVIHRVALGEEHSVGWWTLGGLLVLTIISHVLDFTSSSLGAKKFGATRWGALGGLIGTIVGMFFFPLGLLLGPVIGVLAGELIAGQELVRAGKSTWGTVVGTTAGIIANVFIGLVMIGWFFIAALWH
ncbi:protein of unknown function DUF456 [Chthoniobacter flavus Ellin428]|uniref:DUF456 domain-containing protein n=1 Tax=Chthoniobacter flavus Ellin428 TaxID=497964 RepID=B4CVV5_9BACT|nr:DUF456 family protein [Chthoniobacter flavus]EDY21547.1 protein of unknown function DUF456 [Chthoniobacter flavus Ellin428]TCO95492.1 hypothetical protein EV701_101179 [Chthoniobacter flavus]